MAISATFGPNSTSERTSLSRPWTIRKVGIPDESRNSNQKSAGNAIPAKVAHMYPGQGSQYVGMTNDLSEDTE